MPSQYEYIGNLHMHTLYSDGTAYHAQVAEIARRAGLDFIVVTDHNVLTSGVEGYYGDEDNGYVLLLTGEEVHDQARLPQVNHCLVYGVGQEIAQCASDPQSLIDAVNAAGGMTFLAHPNDHAIEWAHEPAIEWVDWELRGYTGLEIWNYMSRFKDFLGTRGKGVRNIFRPEALMVGPAPETLALWDRLLAAGQHVVGIGNSDAHGTVFNMGPFKKAVFPYEFVFRCVNTHLFLTQPLSGQFEYDRELIYKAVREGRVCISYDLVGSSRGFRYSANGQAGSVSMGGTTRLGAGVTLQVLAPARAHIKLILNGEIVAEEANRENLTYTAHKPGAYRVEVWRHYRGVERCWILSNPIYLENKRSTAST